MGKNSDATTLAINYAYIPYDNLDSLERTRARAKLMEGVGEVIGDGGEFHLVFKNWEKYDKKLDTTIGQWVCRIEELDEEVNK